MATVIVGGQFGDEGKGRVVDDFIPRYGYELVLRYNGGANAGHTVIFGGETYKLHQVPSGIFHPLVTSAIGNGAVVDPWQLVAELEGIEARGIDTRGFLVSTCAHVVMPWHPMLDQLAELKRGNDKIGTTGRGIGPCYEAKARRDGIRMENLLDEEFIEKRIRAIAEEQLGALRNSLVYRQPVPNVDAVIENLKRAAVRLAPYITDVDELARKRHAAGARILLEGAQGTLLDIDLGTYPNVSSSFVTSAGACVGTGLPPTAIKEVVVVLKAYTTRVGSGPFPTELLGEDGDELRAVGREFGTTTGRPRRCGWFDAPIARHACAVNGATGIVLTKLDVLSYLAEIPVCTDYALADGCTAQSVPRQLSQATAKVKLLPGWQKPIDGVTDWNKLPWAAQQYVNSIERLCGVPVIGICTGPARDSVVWRDGGEMWRDRGATAAV